MDGQTIQNSDASKDTMELINGQEERVKKTVNHDIVCKTFFFMCTYECRYVLHTIKNQ